MPKKKSPKSGPKKENSTKFVNQQKISPEKAMKTQLAKIPLNNKKNK